jgi:hypothetical protein
VIINVSYFLAAFHYHEKEIEGLKKLQKENQKETNNNFYNFFNL